MRYDAARDSDCFRNIWYTSIARPLTRSRVSSLPLQHGQAISRDWTVMHDCPFHGGGFQWTSGGRVVSPRDSSRGIPIAQITVGGVLVLPLETALLAS